jgi:hypothetical protein
MFESLRLMPRKLRVEYEGAIYHLMNRKGKGVGPEWRLVKGMVRWFL